MTQTRFFQVELSLAIALSVFLAGPLQAQARRSRPTEKPPEQTEDGPVLTRNFKSVDFTVGEAKASGKILTVVISAVNQGDDRLLLIHRGWPDVSANLVDDNGDTYQAFEYLVGNQKDAADIVSKVRTRVTLRFSMPTAGGVMVAKQIERLTMRVTIGQTNRAEIGTPVVFRQIPIQAQ